MVLGADNLKHVLGNRFVTSLKEAGINYLHVVGIHMIVVYNDLTVILIERDDTLGDFARFTRATLHEHTISPVLSRLEERVGHREHGGEIATRKT